MKSRGRRPAITNQQQTTVARVMRSLVRHHGGCATAEQIVSDLGDVSREAVDRTLASLVDVDYLEINGERRGWARRMQPLHRITDKGRRAAATLIETRTP